MWQIFLTLYFSYLILGPHWIAKSIQGKPLDIVDSTREFGRRSIFISYIALLYTAWMLYAPSYSSFVNALILALSAALGFYVKYGKEDFPMHALLILFILYNGKQYMDLQTWLTVALSGFYAATHNILYLP
jgi:hypothetical protein